MAVAFVTNLNSSFSLLEIIVYWFNCKIKIEWVLWLTEFFLMKAV